MASVKKVKNTNLGAALDVTVESRVVPKVKDDLYKLLSPGMAPLAKGPKDERHLEGKFSGVCDSSGEVSPGPAIPQCIIALVKETAIDGDLEELSGFRVLYYVGFRNTETIIPPPEKDVISRVLYNIGNNEIYHFDGAQQSLEDLTSHLSDKLGTIPERMRLDDKDIFIGRDYFRSLSYKSLCDYTITVRSVPIKHIPQTMSPGGQMSRPRLFIRPPSYHRITVIVDLLASEKAISKIDKLVHKTVDKIKLTEVGRLAESINEKLKAGEDDDADEAPEKMIITKKDKKSIEKMM